MPSSPYRRQILGRALALSALPWLNSCDQRSSGSGTSDPDGGWVGARLDRGHRLRDQGISPSYAVATAAAPLHRVEVLVIGAGVAGLAAARALRGRGIEDVHVLDVEDAAGGNARGHRIGGVACPLGAHYLPVPDTQRPMTTARAELLGFLEEVGLARHALGRWRFEERHLCHAPQERLFIEGVWQEGLLPAAAPGSATQQAYQRMATRIAELQRTLDFGLPSLEQRWSAGLTDLDAIRFGDWLRQQGLAEDESLLGYLDYCCKDDYGAGIDQVSAWAGVNYFASRHGFRVPGAEAISPEHEGVLTWPQGNGWLTEHLAEPLADRFHAGQVALSVREVGPQVEVLVWNTAADRVEAWHARRVVLAVPLRVAARLWHNGPAALSRETARIRQAPWLVANLQLDAPLLQRIGAAPAWDNVVWKPADPAFLGYVDATHQRLDPRPVAPVLTAYFALPESDRARLSDPDWRPWARRVLAAMTPLHPDLPDKLRRIELMRHGHAMRIPVPGTRSSPDLRQLRAVLPGRIQLAHADLAGYSVFEEAFAAGMRLRRWNFP